jgi:hypothetical protein
VVEDGCLSDMEPTEKEVGRRDFGDRPQALGRALRGFDTDVCAGEAVG